MKVEVTREHEWLRQLVGDWTFEHDSPAAPGEMPKKHSGRESVRMLGDVWLVCELNGESPEHGASTSIMTLGYDTTTRQFVGTFVSSMMTDLWVYRNGRLDEASQSLTLRTEGPSFTTPGERSEYLDTIQLISSDERLLISQYVDNDGKSVEFMRARYLRTKAQGEGRPGWMRRTSS